MKNITRPYTIVFIDLNLIVRVSEPALPGGREHLPPQPRVSRKLVWNFLAVPRGHSQNDRQLKCCQLITGLYAQILQCKIFLGTLAAGSFKTLVPVACLPCSWALNSWVLDHRRDYTSTNRRPRFVLMLDLLLGLCVKTAGSYRLPEVAGWWQFPWQPALTARLSL